MLRGAGAGRLRLHVAFARHDEACSQPELHQSHDDVAETPAQASAKNRRHDQRADGGADPERRVHPVQGARPVRHGRVGVQARVDRARADAQHGTERHHAQPGRRQRVA